MGMDEANNKSRFNTQYQTFNGRFKISCMLVLILSEYLFISSPICLNGSTELITLYPYMTITYVVFIGVCYYGYTFCFQNCEMFSVIMFDVASHCIITTGMLSICNVTLCSCDRPQGFYYYLPEILGIVTSCTLMTNSLLWLYKYNSIFEVKNLEV